jgi:glutathione S-transferase
METYDKQNKLLPTYLPSRTRVREWLHAAEGTFLTHALAIARAKRFSPAYALTSVLPQMVKGMSVNVQKDLDWLENGLSQGKGKWLVGDGVTVADIMMEFSVDIIFWGQYGTEDKKWPNIERWLKECHESCGHKRAVKKTGYELKE